MPEHTHHVPATPGAARGNIFVGVDAEPVDVCSRTGRRRWSGVCFRRRRARLAFVDGSVTKPLRRGGADAPTVGRVRARVFQAAPVWPAGLVGLAAVLYLASRLAGAPGGHVSRPSQVMRAATSPAAAGARLLPAPRPSAAARRGRARSRARIRFERAASGSAPRAHGSAATASHMRFVPTAPSFAPPPTPPEPSPNTPGVTANSLAGSSSGASSSGSSQGGPRGSAPFGPGYPGSPSE